MPKYVVLYTAPVSAADQMENNDPEMAAAAMQAWMDWAGKVGDNMVDMGLPLGSGRRLTTSGPSDTQTGVTGYSILSADNLDSAFGLLDGHPHLQLPGASIEVLEALDLPGA